MRRIIAVIMVIVSAVFGVFSYRVSQSSLDLNTTINAAPQKYVGLSEYNSFLNSGMVDLNSNFVKWEYISNLGNFDYLELFLGGIYAYHFKSSEMNITLRLSINPDEWQDNHPWTKGRISVPFSDKMDSMRYCTSDTANNNNVKIIRHNLAYRYGKGGDLYAITWIENGIEFYIAGDDVELHNYPEDGTIICRLLSSDTSIVKSAVAELEAQLPGTRIRQPIPKDTLSAILAVAAVLCLGTAIVLFIIELRRIFSAEKFVASQKRMIIFLYILAALIGSVYIAGCFDYSGIFFDRTFKTNLFKEPKTIQYEYHYMFKNRFGRNAVVVYDRNIKSTVPKGTYAPVLCTSLGALSVRKGMTIPQVVATVGIPDAIHGSGIVRMHYDLPFGCGFDVFTNYAGDSGKDYDPNKQIVSGFAVSGPGGEYHMYNENVDVFLWVLRLIYLGIAVVLGAVLVVLIKVPNAIRKRKAASQPD